MEQHEYGAVNLKYAETAAVNQEKFEEEEPMVNNKPTLESFIPSEKLNLPVGMLIVKLLNII
jgi:hypothetical protein